MGRPPKNMCPTCKGWGETFTATFTIAYYGNGDEIERNQIGVLGSDKCKPCDGSGFKGGKLRQEAAPIIDMLGAKQPGSQEGPPVTTDSDGANGPPEASDTLPVGQPE